MKSRSRGICRTSSGSSERANLSLSPIRASLTPKPLPVAVFGLCGTIHCCCFPYLSLWRLYDPFLLFRPSLDDSPAPTVVPDLNGVRCQNRTCCDPVQWFCLLYTSDAADERSSVDLGGRRIIKK